MLFLIALPVLAFVLYQFPALFGWAGVLVMAVTFAVMDAIRKRGGA